METNAIVNVNKKLVNRTVSFENELVPLNGRILHFSELLPIRPGSAKVSLCEWLEWDFLQPVCSFLLPNH